VRVTVQARANLPPTRRSRLAPPEHAWLSLRITIRSCLWQILHRVATCVTRVFPRPESASLSHAVSGGANTLKDHALAVSLSPADVSSLGHVFCQTCLGRLSQMICPMCRAPMGGTRRIRKIHVDLSKSLDQEDRTLRRLRKLEQALVSEALESRNLTIQRAAELSKKIHEFVKKQPPNEVKPLRSWGARR